VGITRRLNAARALPGGVFPARERERVRFPVVVGRGSFGPPEVRRSIHSDGQTDAHPTVHGDGRKYVHEHVHCGVHDYEHRHSMADASTYRGDDGCASTRIRFYRHVRRFSFGIRANGVTSLICVIPLPESIACHRNSHSRLDAVQTDGAICWTEYDYRRQCKI